MTDLVYSSTFLPPRVTIMSFCICSGLILLHKYTLGALLVCTFNYKSNFHQTRSKRFIFLKGVDQPRQISVEQFICFVEIEAKDA